MKSIFIPLVSVLVALTSCGSKETPRPEAARRAPAAVQAATASLEDWPEIYQATGTVRARTSATLSSKMTGYVQQVNFQVGDRVLQGETLIVLDARDLDANYRRAEAAHAEVESGIGEAESGVAAARASLDFADATFRRMEDLAAKKSISNQEFDEASARRKAAQANFEMARARRRQIDARLAQAGEEQRAAGIVRDYAKITAPFGGMVTAKSVEPGNLASPGIPLLTLEGAGSYRLEAAVDESRLPAVRVGQNVSVALDAPGCETAARISEIVPAVDAASRSYLVKIDLPANWRCVAVRSGAFGRASFSLTRRRTLAIPAAAVMERGQLQTVFVAEEGCAHARLITTGERIKGKVDVLSGLKEGERVIVPVPVGLADGAEVEVRR